MTAYINKYWFIHLFISIQP